MKISIFGIGYVGCVSLGCLAKMGHELTGVDKSEHKNNLINNGFPTIIEKDIERLIKDGREKGLIHATSNVSKAIMNSDLSFICVGTPNKEYGHLNTDNLKTVAIEIADVLSEKSVFHPIVIRSTVMPGTTDEITNIIAKHSNKRPDIDFCVLVNPEFLREGNAVADYFNPSVTVIGGSCAKGIKMLKEIYTDLPGKKEIVDLKVAETIKLLNNSFHALKVAFANEIGTISKAMKINTHQLIDLFLADSKLNISTAYLNPGFAYGGSCLPKDLLALNLIAHDLYLDVPVLRNIEKSNSSQISRAIKIIEGYKVKKVAFWGISFKDNTDDLRNSPVIIVIEQLLGKGYEVVLFDEYINESQLIGANKEYIEQVLPHFNSLLVRNFDQLLNNSELLVINKNGDSSIYNKILNKPELKIFDLKNIPSLSKHKNYQGFNW